MSLPISEIVRVDISIAPTAVPLAGFGEELFLTEETGVISPTERQRKYKSLAGVQSDWAATTEVVKAATAFYAQVPQPMDFTVGIISVTAFGGLLIGGVPNTLADIKAVTTGGLTIAIDGTTINPTGVDFTTAADMDGVATIMQSALDSELTGTTCVYSGGRFQVGSPSTGVNSSVSYATVDIDGLSRVLGLRQADLGIISNGGDGETPATALPKIAEVSNSFVAVDLNKIYRDTPAILDVADWCQASDKLFMNTTNDISTLNIITAPSTIAGQLKAKALSKTNTIYAPDADQYPASSLFGRIATVNYEGTNTVINTKFKRLPTITVADIKSNQKASLDSINVGAFYDYGVALFYAEGRMADSSWLDSQHALMWLKNRIQIGVFNRMLTANKIPYTDAGVGILVQEVVSALQQGITNGFLAPGDNAAGEYLPLGYRVTTIPIADVPQADKANRLYRGIGFEAVGAGALNNVVISGNFNE